MTPTKTAAKAPTARPIAKAKPQPTRPATQTRPAAPTGGNPMIAKHAAPTPTAKAPAMPMGTPPAGTAMRFNGAQAEALGQTMRPTGGSVGPDTHDARMAARHKLAHKKAGR